MICDHPIAAAGGTCFICILPVLADPSAGEIEKLLAAQAGIEAELQKRHAAESRQSLAAFLKHGWRVLEPMVELDWAWHIQVLCDHIQAMLEDWESAQNDDDFVQRCKNLVINVPPGSLKSRILSVYAPAWMWIRRPDWRVLCLSENPNVAIRDARFSRELMASEWYQSWFQPQWSIRKDQDAIGDFGNTMGGARKSQGLNAKVVGLRGDAILIDDPNDTKDTSEVKLESVWDRWYAARNRVNDPRKSIRMGIMQRVHEGDWTGRLLEPGEDGEVTIWHHLSIPMEREFDEHGDELECISCKVVHGPTFLGWVDPRKLDGEVLHPERNTPEVLKAEKRGLGSYGTAGQLQQRPAPLGGGMFKDTYWREFDTLERTKSGRPKFQKLVLSVDATFKKTGTSRVAIGAILGHGPKRMILRVHAEKMDIVETEEVIDSFVAEFPFYTKLLIEDKANGSALITILSKKYRAVEGCNPQGGKVARCVAIQPTVQAGNCYVPRNAPWKDEFKGEMGSFPNGRYDDIPDMVSQALIDMEEVSLGAKIGGMGKL